MKKQETQISDSKKASSQLLEKNKLAHFGHFINLKFLSVSILVLTCAYTLSLVINSPVSRNLIFPFSYFSTQSLPVNNKQSQDNVNLDQKRMAAADSTSDSWKNAKTIYEFSATDIDGNLVDLSKYKYIFSVLCCSN
jgi:hypothetical protein